MPLMEWAGGFKRLLKVLGAHGMAVVLRPSSIVGHGHHLLPTALPVLVPLVAAMLGRSRVIATVPTTEVADSLGLNGLLAGGILDGDV